MGLRANSKHLLQVSSKGSNQVNSQGKDSNLGKVSSQDRELQQAPALKIMQGQALTLAKVRALKLDCQAAKKAMAKAETGRQVRSGALVAKVELEAQDRRY
jgi:hypothetical protein